MLVLDWHDSLEDLSYTTIPKFKGIPPQERLGYEKHPRTSQ